MKIIKEELRFEENLKKRLEFICEFSKVTPTFINGSIRKLEKTNLTYIEPHRVIIKEKLFLFFNNNPVPPIDKNINPNPGNIKNIKSNDFIPILLGLFLS